MYKQICAIMSIVCILVVLGCAAGSRKPGTGGKSSVTEIEDNAHPDFPDGVACYVCHKNDIPAHEFHKDFGNKCEQCHVMTTWMAQKYPHTKWPLNEIHNVRCTRCHMMTGTYDYSLYQCYGCHHEEAGIKKSHAKLNIDDLSKCAECHKGFPEK